MKNRHIESLLRAMRQYHRHHPWQLDEGLYIPHAYPPEAQPRLAWWDDVGFIEGGRRVMLYWRHPRSVYRDAIVTQAQAEIAEPPLDALEFRVTQHRSQGRSRKRPAYFTLVEPTPERAAYTEAVRTREDALLRDGIDLQVRPTLQVGWTKWATTMDLVAPLEVLGREDVRALAELGRRLLRRQTTVEEQWPGRVYERADWLSEADTAVAGEPPHLVYRSR